MQNSDEEIVASAALHAGFSGIASAARQLSFSNCQSRSCLWAARREN
jgi:hypothetical protein